MREPFTYESPFYQEVIQWLEERWGRKLDEHERHILIEGYRFGRLTEMDNEIKILFAN